MTGRRLIIEGTWPRRRALTSAEFLWRMSPSETSFATNLDPRLTSIGAVPAPNIDFVALAVAVFLADRTIRRPRGGWERRIELDLPVLDPEGWTNHQDDLAETLNILSGDAWSFTFRPRQGRKGSDVRKRPDIDRVLLFSGGADSLCGAVKSLAAGERLLLMSHWDWAGHSDYQRRLATWLSRRFPDQVSHRQHHLARRRRQLAGGPAFGDEPTRRSRSLLFVALGLAHSSIAPEAPLWVAENGYAALNPPLAGERRGTLSTRTTHPVVLERIQKLVESLGGFGNLENPFALETKGDMYATVARLLGDGDAVELLSMSHSCSHVRWATGTGLPPSTQCGICFGCLVRRSAFLAAGLEDRTVYLHSALKQRNLPAHLKRASREEIRTVRYAGRRGVSAGPLLAAGLPDSFDQADAVRVAQRGLAELAAVVEAAEDLAIVR